MISAMRNLEILNRAMDIIEPLGLSTPGTAWHGQILNMALEIIRDRPETPDYVVRLEIQEMVT